jgi:hypothetical protein
MRNFALASLLIAALSIPLTAQAGPVRATARATGTAVVVTGKTAVKGTAVVGRTAVRGAAATGRGLALGTVCVATLFHRCGAP